MSKLSDVLLSSVCENIITLLTSKVQDRDYFHRNYKVLNTEECKQRNGSFGKVLKVLGEDNKIYAIKKVIINEENLNKCPNICMFLLLLQEAVLQSSLNLRGDNIIKFYPEHTWAVLPKDIDPGAVLDVIYQGIDVALADLSIFLGKRLSPVFGPHMY